MKEITKSAKMTLLAKIKSGEPVTFQKEDQVMFDIFSDDMISIHADGSISITYYGLYELERWDSVLGVSINDQLLCKPHGDA